jgi:hypothetical protein
MKVFRIFRNTLNGKIWFISIENFLSETPYQKHYILFQEIGVKNLNDLFVYYKKNELSQLIESFELNQVDKNGLLKYINFELAQLDRIKKHNKLFIWIFIGLILLIIPFINVDGSSKYNYEDAVSLIRNYIISSKIISLIFNLALFSFLIFKKNMKPFTYTLLISVSLLIFLNSCFQFMMIFQANSFLAKINTTVYPTIGLIGSTIINLLIIMELIKTKKLVKLEDTKISDLRY